jgi:hypothetical protein
MALLRLSGSTLVETAIELRQDEVRRIPLLGSRVNEGSRSPDSCAPTAPALSHI